MFRNELYIGLTVSKERGRERNICKQDKQGLKGKKKVFKKYIFG